MVLGVVFVMVAEV